MVYELYAIYKPLCVMITVTSLIYYSIFLFLAIQMSDITNDEK